jgi:hypothetical protein
MERLWITNGSTRIAPVANPLNAACDAGYIPTDIYLLDNPQVHDITTSVETLAKTIVTAHGGEEPAITIETIDDELDFDAIVHYLQSAIEAGQDAGAEVAVDVTPGRKFWSIISFQAGRKYEVDHLYYVHLKTSDYFGEIYPNIPRPTLDLIDFTEVL